MDYLQQLKTEIERRYGRQPESPVDYSDLALQIKKKTGKEISSYTLMRIWGHVKNNSSPRQDTLSNLARYAGYAGWKDFVGQKDALAVSDRVEDGNSETHESEGVSSAQKSVDVSVNKQELDLRGGANEKKETIRKGNPVLMLGVAVVLISLGIGLGLLIRKHASAPPHEFVSDVLVSDEGTLSWSLDMTTWELTVTGNGQMMDFRRGAPAEAWLEYRDSLRSVVIGEGVTHIGDCAFRNCTMLASVVLPKSCTSIGDYAFDRCSALTNIDLPAGLTSIGRTAFWGCKRLQKIVLPRGVTRIESELFCYCSSLQSCSILGPITSLNEYAFAECESLEHIQLPEGLQLIGLSAFSNCYSLTRMDIPEGVATIYDYAFHNCKSMTEVTLPSTLSYVGNQAFELCSHLRHIDCRAPKAPDLGYDIFIGIPPSSVRLTYPQGANYSNWFSLLP